MTVQNSRHVKKWSRDRILRIIRSQGHFECDKYRYLHDSRRSLANGLVRQGVLKRERSGKTLYYTLNTKLIGEQKND